MTAGLASKIIISTANKWSFMSMHQQQGDFTYQEHLRRLFVCSPARAGTFPTICACPQCLTSQNVHWSLLKILSELLTSVASATSFIAQDWLHHLLDSHAIALHPNASKICSSSSPTTCGSCTPSAFPIVVSQAAS